MRAIIVVRGSVFTGDAAAAEPAIADSTTTAATTAIGPAVFLCTSLIRAVAPSWALTLTAREGLHQVPTGRDDEHRHSFVLHPLSASPMPENDFHAHRIAAVL